jgi:hypothetical protein
MYWREIKKITNINYSIPVIIVSSYLAGCLSMQDTPTIGASAIAFSIMAIYFVSIGLFVGLKNKHVVKYFGTFITLVVLQILITPGLNLMIHGLSFGITAVFCLLFNKLVYRVGA